MEPQGLSGPRAELHYLGSGIQFGLISSGCCFLIAWIMFFFIFEMLTDCLSKILDGSLSFVGARLLRYHDFPLRVRLLFSFRTETLFFLWQTTKRQRQPQNHMGKIQRKIDELINDLMIITMNLLRNPLSIVHGSWFIPHGQERALAIRRRGGRWVGWRGWAGARPARARALSWP